MKMNNHLPAKPWWPYTCILWQLLVIFSPLSIQAQSNILIGTEHKIQSRILGEERRYAVNLPESYERDDFYLQKKYPVLILLDAGTHFQSASGIIHYMGWNEQIPEMIVVGIFNTDRTRDLSPTKLQALASSGGGANFLRFIETELLPQIDKDYRTLPYRVLVGHSLAGLFTVDLFLNRSFFNAYLAIDPSLGWDDQIVVKKARTILSNTQSFKSSLYLAQANNPFNEGKDAGTRGKSFQDFVASLAGNKSQGLRYSYAFFEKEDHFSVPLLSLYHGLTFIFEGYKFPLNTLAKSSAEDVRKHYQQLFQRLGVDLRPPGKLLDGVALYLLNNEKKIDQAIELLKLNQEYYPRSFITYNSLADAYKVKGNKEQAIINYRKSLAINPNNESAKRALKELAPD